jgi:hypothetical protein
VNLRRQAEYFTYFMDAALQSPRTGGLFHGLVVPFPPARGRPPPAARRRLLDLAAVRFVVMPRSVTESPPVQEFVRDAGLEPRPALDPGLALFENPHALPRAFVVHRVSPAPPPAELLAALGAADFDPLAESYAEVDPGFAVRSDAPKRGAPATIVRDEARVVEVDATLPAPGFVVLADSYYPGWRATVDGVPASILPTNHLFRGVSVPAGAHRVRFEYRPRSVPLGAALSVAGIVAIAAALMRARPARSPQLLPPEGA